MAERSVFAEPRTIVVVHRLYELLARIADNIGDQSLVEYACLVRAAEMPKGWPLRQLRVDCAWVVEPLHYVAMLEEKELVQRVRDPQDKRGFAIMATVKGRSKIQQVDLAMATAIIDLNARFTEEVFEHFVGQMQGYAARRNPGSQTVGFFPGAMLTLLCRLHHYVIRKSSIAGMSSLQISILCCLAEGASLPVSALAQTLRIPPDLLATQLDHMEDRYLEDGDGLYTINANGYERLHLFLIHILEDMLSAQRAQGEAVAMALEELGEYLLYLFG